MRAAALGQETAPAGRLPRAVLRVQENLLAQPERELLDWLCGQMPRPITSDLLTGLACLGALVAFAGYLGSQVNPEFFWLASAGLLIHWFGDSLDGSLARYRGRERPLYGYFLDHSVDVLCNFVIMAGVGLSPYIRLDAALFALIGYFMLCMYVFLFNHVSESFRLSFLALGPTELKLILIGMNCWMYLAGNSKLFIGPLALSPYDLVLCGGGLVFLLLFAVNVFATARDLGMADPPRAGEHLPPADLAPAQFRALEESR